MKDNFVGCAEAPSKPEETKNRTPPSCQNDEVQKEEQELDVEAQEEQHFEKMVEDFKEREQRKINVLSKAKPAKTCTLQ